MDLVYFLLLSGRSCGGACRGPEAALGSVSVRTLLRRSEVSLLFLLPQCGEVEAQGDGAPAPRRIRSGVPEPAGCPESTRPRTSAFLAPKPALGSALEKRQEVGEEWTWPARITKSCWA